MWKDTLMWVSDNAGLIFSASILVLAVGSVLCVAAYDRRASIRAYFEHRRTIRIQRGLVMGRKKNADRKAYLKGRWSDGLTDFGEKEWMEGRQTREEVNSAYRMFGKTHNMPDLLPHLTAEQLKSAIKGRRSRGAPGPAQEKPAWGDPPAPVTAAAPAGDNVIHAAKKFGAKALAKLQKTA